jgi:hypothetical protein
VKPSSKLEKMNGHLISITNPLNGFVVLIKITLLELELHY